jgi:hypothetical protein
MALARTLNGIPVAFDTFFSNEFGFFLIFTINRANSLAFSSLILGFNNSLSV